MKTTSRIAGWLFVTALGTGAPALAGAPWSAALPPLAEALLAQARSSSAAAGPKAQVDDLLARARKAIKDGNLETADSLVSRAEGMKVEYGPFHFGDTPAKARRDLESARRPARQAPSKPSQRVQPESSTGAATDGTARAAGAGRAPGSPPTLRAVEALSTEGAASAGDNLPSLGRPSDDDLPGAIDRARMGQAPLDPNRAAALRQPEDRLQPALPAAAAERQRSDRALLDARRALAVGDVRRASALVEQAKNFGAEYAAHEDSPAKVSAAIRKHNEVIELGKGRQDSEGWRRQYADLLMEQSQQLLRWKEYEEAERLANSASRLGVSYNQFEVQPSSLLEKIAAERKQSGQGGAAPSAAAAPSELSDPALAQPIGGSSRRTAPAALRNPATPSDKDRALDAVRQARAALAEGNLVQAEQLARQAESLKVPDAAFGPQDDRPWMVSLDVQKARLRGQGVVRSGGPAEAPGSANVQALYNRQQDATRNRPAANQAASAAAPGRLDPGRSPPSSGLQPLPAVGSETLATPPGEDAQALYEAGRQALRERDPDKALKLFRQAYAQREQLDAPTLQRLQDHLQLLSVPSAAKLGGEKETLLDATAARQQALVKQVSTEVANRQLAAKKMLEREPQRAVETLKEGKVAVEKSGLDSEAKTLLLKRLDATLTEVDQYILRNKAQIELDAQNKAVLDDVERRRNLKIEIDDKLAQMVNQYNQLMDEQRFAEAHVVAKRAAELDPENVLVKQITWHSRFMERTKNQQALGLRKEAAVFDTLASAEKSGVPFDDSKPFQFGNATAWKELTESRKNRFGQAETRRSERELEIERKLKTPVLLKFHESPLSSVIEQLGKLADVNIHLDPQGLTEENVSADTPITIELSKEIQLKSALVLILQPLRLSFVIKDEVLKITSEHLRDTDVYPITYSVANLVVPIPNFVPNRNFGLTGALSGALADAGGAVANSQGGLPVGAAQTPTAVVASKGGGTTNAVINPAVMAQMNQALSNGGPTPGVNQPFSFGPGGAGGGAQADFDSLIDLIKSTVQPTTWDDVGGPGSIAPFETNLSLVVSQTQEVHEQIKDLLEQLRRLQDLQVTIEVRFITLNDNFFERIGVDFDFDIDDNVGPGITGAQLLARDDRGPSATVGILPAPVAGGVPALSSNLDIPFRQESFSLATPQFGQPVDVASFGFAILSDIEAYFLVSAAQGDRRSNVLQAPKVTLFNGQQAFVSDTSQTPFVISVIPVVGDFAAAQQPVIVVLSEGTFLTVQAVVSNDRRFVRLTVVPFFSQIGDVKEFTFTGSKTVKKSSSSSTDGDDTSADEDVTEETAEGVTVQLPTFSFVTVTTTVSVPDGGTVLLGGIKRLSEGRNEFGVPILSKLPYINRLFKNVGIGRETQSLMMMVTPRIIIQEEEEEKLGVPATP